MPFHMALDEVLFNQKKALEDPTPILRFYYSSEPWITTGYSFNKPSGYSVDSSEILESNIPSCRRLTGGGNVLHGDDLIFSIIAKTSFHKEDFRSLRVCYLKIRL